MYLFIHWNLLCAIAIPEKIKHIGIYLVWNLMRALAIPKVIEYNKYLYTMETLVFRGYSTWDWIHLLSIYIDYFANRDIG